MISITILFKSSPVSSLLSQVFPTIICCSAYSSPSPAKPPFKIFVGKNVLQSGMSGSLLSALRNKLTVDGPMISPL